MGILELLILVVVVCWIFGSLPYWPHSRAWGPGPSLIGVVLLVLVLLFLFGGLGGGHHLSLR